MPRVTMSFRWGKSLACPFFVPREILNDGSWPHPSRLPLGAGWTGECCATGTPKQPDDSAIRDFCNLGYATGCKHLPAARDWDAVRFIVASTGSNQIALSFVCELGHAPAAHGRLTFDLVHDRWLAVHADARVQRLAESYLRAYRVRQASPSIEQVITS
jgi:hypothetical protein